MAKTYKVNRRLKLINQIMNLMIRWNIAPTQTYLLIVPGRVIGKLYSTPVSLVEQDGNRWLVAPYGEVSWVKNARAADEVSISRNGETENYKIKEINSTESAPILKAYLSIEPITRPYFDSQPDSPLEEFEVEATRHPVFLLE